LRPFFKRQARDTIAMMTLPLLALVFALQAAPRPSNQAAAYGLFLEALSLREAGNASAALKALEKTLAADPKAADAYAEIARIQVEEGKFDLAVAAINQALKVAPKRADLRSLAGQVHQYYGQSGGGEAELRLAAREYETAATLSPGDPGPLRDLTRVYSALRDAKAGLDAWKRLAEADPRNPESFVQVAALSMAAGDTKAAIEALETAVQADPSNPRALQLLGDIKQQAGQTEEAYKHYEAAARLDERDLITRLKMGEILIETHKGEPALQMAEGMLKQDPKNRFALDLKARAFKELGRVDEALAIAESLSAGDPKDLKAAFLVVVLLEQKGSLEAAHEKLNALLRRNTSSEDPESIARNNRVFWAHTGIVRQRLGRFREAADAFGEAANSGKEKDAALVSYRIEALLAAKEFDKALQETRAARSDSGIKEDGDLRFLEAYALRGSGDAKGASALVEGILAAPKDETQDTLAAADFYQRGKDLVRAAELFRKVADKDPKNFRALFSLGAALERQKRFDEAEKAFRAALALSPDSAIALNYLGYMNADRNVKVAEALALIQKALVSDPENGSYLDSLAWALYRLGRNAEAEVAIRKAHKEQEKNAVVIAHLGMILAAKGENAEALKYLRLALEGEDEDGELDRSLVEGKIRALSQAAQKKP
jgi:tetratricopeptide (TPR) repeat protein